MIIGCAICNAGHSVSLDHLKNTGTAETEWRIRGLYEELADGEISTAFLPWLNRQFVTIGLISSVPFSLRAISSVEAEGGKAQTVRHCVRAWSLR